MVEDVVTFEYDDKEHKQYQINLFKKYGYDVVSENYLENVKLNKGVILKQRVTDDEPAVLTCGIY